MVATVHPHPEISDVFVVGAGLAGAAAAIGFARAGLRVVSSGALDRLGQGRTVALFGPSIAFLKDLGVWNEIEAAAAPLRSLRIVDDTGSLFSPRPVEFRASEIGLDAFGWNIENARLADILGGPLAREANIQRVDSRVAQFEFATGEARLTTSEGRQFTASLVVGADGRASATRKAAGIDVSVHRYGQSALTLFLRHSRQHEDFSSEFHTREGPFTLVPLPGTPEAPIRSSLVWVMSDAQARRRAALDDESLVNEIHAQSRGLLGDLSIDGGRGTFPMLRQNVRRLTGVRLALVGDAAHAFPPIGAQGLNLGLRDVAAILRAALAARRDGADIGARATLARYAEDRRPDIAVRMIAVNGLNLSLLADFAPVDALRGLGLTALRRIGPLRRLVMREGVTPATARRKLG